jgi:hypothetical protein
MDCLRAGARPPVGFVVVLAMLLAGGAGCSSDSGGTKAPELVKVLVQAAGAMDVDLLAPPDGGVGAVLPTQQIKLVFNQLLDGDKIETILDGGGVVGRTDVASLTWTGAPAGAPAIQAVTTYDPTGAVGVTIPAPSVVVHAEPGLPSGAMLSLALVRDKITSKKGTPFVGATSYMLQTAPFSVEVNSMDGETVAPEFTFSLTFSNVPAESIGGAVTVTAGGAPVAIDVKPDDMNPLVRVVTPQGGAWPVGPAYVLTVGAAGADLFGVKLAAPATLGFAVARATGDGGAAIPDGGAVGGGDGASDRGGDGASDGPGDSGGAGLDAADDVPAGG